MFDIPTSELLTYAGISFGTLGGGTVLKLLYDGTHARIKKTEDNIGKLFEKVEKVRTDMNGGFESVRKDMTSYHIDLIERLPRKQ